MEVMNHMRKERRMSAWPAFWQTGRTVRIESADRNPH